MILEIIVKFLLQGDYPLIFLLGKKDSVVMLHFVRDAYAHEF
jgi:hypothetical protein